MNHRMSPWSLLRLSGAYHVGRRITRDAVAVLTYHRVRRDGPWMQGLRHPNVVSTREFDRQLAYLTRHYHVMDGEAFRRYLTAGAALPPNPVVITFDDGYRDNAAEALPVLRARGAAAIFFVTTGFVGEASRRLWLDRLDAIVAAVGDAGLTRWLAARGLPLDLRAGGRFRAWVKRLSRARRLEVLSDLQRAFARQIRATDDDAPMTWDEIEELASAGMTIGSHTVSHQILGAASPEEVRDELRSSRAEIERRLRVPCWAFSYPNGEADDFRAADIDELRAAGYSCAFTQIPGFVNRRSGAFALPRIPVPAAPGIEVFESRVSGVHAWLSARRQGAVPA